jgi:hypothetical protein
MIYVIIVVLFAFVILFYWVSRNPFNLYLIRAFAFNNLFFTFIALILFFSRISIALTEYPVIFVFFLFPSGVYLVITFKWSNISIPKDKSVGSLLAFTGRTKAAQRLFFNDNNMEDRIKQEELITKQKKVYKYKLIIASTIALTLSSFAALIFGFY